MALAKPTNSELVLRWMNGEVLFPFGLWALGDKIYSYGVCIARRERDRPVGGRTTHVWIVPLPFFSKTTSCHVQAVKKGAEATGIPVTLGEPTLAAELN